MTIMRRAAGTMLLLPGVLLPGLVLGPTHDSTLIADTIDRFEQVLERPAERAEEPVYAFIPRIGIAATIVPVGLTEEDQMESPKSWEDIGWYQHGVHPGEAGNAVLAGHLDSDRGPAVFWDLEKLEPGDIVIIVDARGTRRRFAITGSERYTTDDVPMQELFGKRDDPRLVLITCEGAWGSAGYEERLAVFAQPLEEDQSIRSAYTTKR